MAKKLSTSELLVAVNDIVCGCQGITPPWGTFITDEYWVSLPRLTSQFSNEPTAPPSSCPPA